jgi:ribosomal protein S13
MHRGWYLLLYGLALGPLSVASASQSSSTGSVYKWTDDKGVVHYGDSVPPEYSQNERSVLNSHGVEVGHVEGANNATASAEKARQAEEVRQKAQHDQFLLATYLSTKDIEQLRDERVGQIEGQIKASLVYIDGLGTRLLALVDRSTHFKPYSSDPKARRLPDDLAEELVRVSSETRSQRQALDAKHKEQADMRAQFDADIARFRELTAKPRS